MAPSCAPPPILHEFGRKKKSKPIKIFSGVGHGIKKPKPKKKSKSPVRKKTPPSTKPVSVRQSMREKFDFSRTPYAVTPKVIKRVPLSEECSKKRKFFKTTVEVESRLPKRAKVDEIPLMSEFDDMNTVEEPEFDEIKKDVFSILDEWDDDDVNFKPQMTRQKADELQTETTHLSLSYITPSTKSSEDQHSSNVSNTTIVQEDTPSVNRSVDSDRDKSLQIPVEHSENSPEIAMAKLFAAVTTPPAKSVLNDVTNKNKKAKASLFKAAAPVDQLQIDAGQKVIGPVECSKCGMVYDVGDPVDEKRHADYHTKRHELKYKSSKTDKVVGICGADRIIFIRYSDEKKRDKIQKILKITEEEIGFGYTWGLYSVAFVYVRNDRILGCLVAEPNVLANRVVQSDGIVLLSPESQAVKCGINRIWVKKEFRGHKIGTELVNCLRKNFVYGDYLKIDDIAFSVTTPEGHAFARKYTGRQDYLTYEEPMAHKY